MKYHKGYNGAYRKAQRAIKRMTELYRDGASFDDLWSIYEPLDKLRYEIPQVDRVQTLITQGESMLHAVAQWEYEQEVLADYWSSVL